MTFVGIDISKRTLDVAALLPTAEIKRVQLQNTSSGHTQLHTWLEALDDCHIVMEATGSYHQRLAQLLQPKHALSVLNPAQVSYFSKSQHRRNKTDSSDALTLALYAKERQPTPTLTPPPLRQSLARELEAISDDLTRLKNRLEAAEQGVTHSEVEASLRRRITVLEDEKHTLQEKLERETKKVNHHDLTLLQSIPGIGVRTACLLLAELGDVKRFASARKLVAFAGLTPTRFESGSSVRRRSRISRLGSAHVRRLLFMPALAAIRYNPVPKSFFTRLVENGKNKKAALIACMGKLLRIVYAVLVHQRPFDPACNP